MERLKSHIESLLDEQEKRRAIGTESKTYIMLYYVLCLCYAVF